MWTESTSAVDESQNPGQEELLNSKDGAKQGAGKRSHAIFPIGLLAALGAGIALLFKVLGVLLYITTITSGLEFGKSMDGAKEGAMKGSNTIFLIGLVAASGAGIALLFKKVFVPRFKSWIRKVVSEDDEEDKFMKKTNISKPSQAEAVLAKLVVATVNLAESSKQLLSLIIEGTNNDEALLNMLNAQQREMDSLNNAILKLELDSASSALALTKHRTSLLSSTEVPNPKGIFPKNPNSIRLKPSGIEPRDEVTTYPHYSPLGCTRIGPLDLDPRLIR